MNSSGLPRTINFHENLSERRQIELSANEFRLSPVDRAKNGRIKSDHFLRIEEKQESFRKRSLPGRSRSWLAEAGGRVLNSIELPVADAAAAAGVQLFSLPRADD